MKEIIGDDVLLSILNSVIFIISIILQIFFFAYGLYIFVVSLFAWFKKREKPLITNKYHKYALIVAAHDEEAVIGNMVDSLKQIDYPADCFDIFVIADNCTDNTAAIAKEHGALVYERTNHELRGKGYALEWMFNIIFGLEKHYDSVAVFDADNLVHKNFLIEMNKKQNQGYKVVQGYIDSKNPFDSWISSSYSISFWCVNKLYQQARYNLGLSCQLCGTGFVLDTELLKEIGWQATCLTEDMEFTMRLSLEDTIVAWANDAVVYDEKPVTFIASWHQRKRWMQGHADVASRFVAPLLKKAIKEKKWSPVDCVIYLLQPVRIIIMGLITLMMWLQMAFPDGEIAFFQISYLFPTEIWLLFVAAEFAYTPLIVWIEKHQLSPKMLLCYVTYSFYSLTWVPITILGILDKNKKEWSHTKHTRQMSIEEMK